MTDATVSLERPAMRPASARPVVDIAIVFAVSALAYVLEGLVDARGWISVGEQARGASAVVAGALTALAVVVARGDRLADIGFRRPARWAIVPLQAGVILIAFVAAQFVAPIAVSLIVDVPAPDMSRYASIAGNAGAAVTMALLLPFTASIPEEIIYRGFLIGRLSAIFGTGARGVTIAVIAQALVFGAVHYTWGFGGMLMTVMMGLVWGTAYLSCGRNLWVVIVAHSAGHLLFVLQLYLAEPAIT